MKVSKKLAAELVGIGRTTFYRHIDEKPISVDASGKIDFSELLRVYGNENVKTPDQLKKAKQNKEEGSDDADVTLKSEVERLKAELSKANSERQREREQLTEEIENLRNSLNKSMDQNGNLTRLLTDQRDKDLTTLTDKEKAQEETLQELIARVKEIQEAQKVPEGLLARFSSFWKKAQ